MLNYTGAPRLGRCGFRRRRAASLGGSGRSGCCRPTSRPWSGRTRCARRRDPRQPRPRAKNWGLQTCVPEPSVTPAGLVWQAVDAMEREIVVHSHGAALDSAGAAAGMGPGQRKPPPSSHENSDRSGRYLTVRWGAYRNERYYEMRLTDDFGVRQARRSRIVHCCARGGAT